MERKKERKDDKSNFDLLSVVFRFPLLLLEYLCLFGSENKRKERKNKGGKEKGK